MVACRALTYVTGHVRLAREELEIWHFISRGSSILFPLFGEIRSYDDYGCLDFILTLEVFFSPLSVRH